jgi:hypothetical protein
MNRLPRLVVLSFALLLLAWSMSSRPFTGPDETSHYQRAASIADGTLLGPRVRYPPPRGLTPTMAAFVDHDTRAVRISPALAPYVAMCLDGTPTRGRACMEPTPTGDYFPLPYLLPALAIDASSTVDTAWWLTRLAAAAPCLAFILLALAMALSGGAWSLVGVLGAATPMVLFVGSVVNPSGLEIAASLAFAATVLRICRAPAAVGRGTWAALAISGAVALDSWQAGPGFVAADLALGAAMLGWPGVRTLVTANRRGLLSAGLVLLIAGILFLIYASVSGVEHTPLVSHAIRANLKAGLDQLGPVLHEAVGSFGGLTVRLAGAAYWIWWLFIVGLLAAAVVLGNRRRRLTVVGVALVAFAFPVFTYAFLQRNSGFALQGRYVLPILGLIPLVCGEVIGARSATLRAPMATGLPAATIAAVACFQLYAWWVNAGVNASGSSELWFADDATWSPPLGWAPWIVCALLGAASLIAYAARQMSTGAAPMSAAVG